MSATPPVVLFTVGDSTRKKFLPNYDSRQLPPFREEWSAGRTPDEWDKLLRSLRPEVLVTGWDSAGILEAMKRDPDCSVRYICHLTGGVKGVVSREMIERGVLVSNWGGTISHMIAEHALLLTLGALRSMTLWRQHMENPHSPKFPINTRSLCGRKVGIHGFGAIVRHLVSFLKPFNVEISSYSAGVPAELFREHGVRRCDSLEELASGCEIFVELEAWTPQTEGSVNARILNLLPEGAVFVNVGRGAVVDEAALGELAVSGKLIVAADVFTREPLPTDSPLMQVPTALLSPHIAGPTQDGYPLCGDFAIANLKRYLSGHPEQIEGRVTVEIYDRTT